MISIEVSGILTSSVRDCDPYRVYSRSLGIDDCQYDPWIGGVFAS